ncbi:hypothetical protein [Clostridium estertheticum]|nr:hypothetical protein [Clostridium estertheticum]MBZ9615293.1 hypothetical protein [Clostridium estertheticum subsp. laramiense]WAG75182.1 hypothetical protein LL032_06955 [Clostridium estertheticum]
MMYYAFKLHDISPSVFQNYAAGEKIIISAFISKEVDEINEENKKGSE